VKWQESYLNAHMKGFGVCRGTGRYSDTLPMQWRIYIHVYIVKNYEAIP
jgi:hypothetical protein